MNSTKSSTDVFAEPMLNSEGFLQDYKDQLRELKKKGLLPRLDETLTYYVYSLEGSRFGSHRSIVLTIADKDFHSADEKHFLTVELGFITEKDGTKRIYPFTEHLKEPFKSKLKYLGTIDAKGKDLIVKAVAVMKEFGSYFKYGNNCQDYCNKYLEAIGLAEAKKATDIEKVVAGIAAFLFSIFP